MKLPFTINLAGIKGVFARKTPKGGKGDDASDDDDVDAPKKRGGKKGKGKGKDKDKGKGGSKDKSKGEAKGGVLKAKIGGLFAAIAAKLPGKKKAAGKKERDEEDFMPSSADDDDMFADLGDLDELDAEAKLRQEEARTAAASTSAPEGDGDDFDNDDGDRETHGLEKLDDVSAGGSGADQDEEIDLSVLEAMPNFGDADEGEDEDGGDKKKKRKLILIAAGGIAAAVVIGASSWLLLGGGGTSDTAPADKGAVVKHDLMVSLDNVPFVEQQIEARAPKTRAPDAPASGAPAPAEGAATASGEAPPAPAAPAESAQPGEGGDFTLSQLGLGVAQEPGVGVVVPSGTKASFTGVPAAPKGQPLAAAPIGTLMEQTQTGTLPKIAQDGQTPYQGYARPAPAMAGDRPKVAIIVSGVGLSRAATESALAAMPENVTLALDIYSRGLDFWVSRARDDGHEVLLTVPLESGDFPFDDPGPDALKSLQSPEENVAKLTELLKRTSGYFGVMADYGGKFLTIEGQVDAMLGALNARGLMYVDSPVPGSLGSRAALQLNMPWAAVDMSLDNAQGRAEFERLLESFENLANKRAIAVARVTATPLSMEQLHAWISTLNQKGIELVPLSALAKKQMIR